MMKNLTLLFILFSFYACAQETKTYDLKEESTSFTSREVDRMAVYEGCEVYPTAQENVTCFSSMMNQKFIQLFNSKFDHTKLPKGVVKITYVIGKEGKLKEIKGQGVQELIPYALEVFDEINKDIIYQPAIKNGVPVDVKFSMPFRLQ
ncbi:MAG: hypothetical protein KIG88_13265 [Weeksellaceae bacterium]|nr:hypothetical protein [Weeksellaceae bacterium]